jgi:hypothetical protein
MARLNAACLARRGLPPWLNKKSAVYLVSLHALVVP